MTRGFPTDHSRESTSTTLALSAGFLAAFRSKGAFALCAMSLVLVACSDDPTPPAVDLPPGWANAQSVRSFTQSACTASAYDPNVHETLEVTGGPASVNVAYHNAHFRCSQLVEGFALAPPGAFDVLVQPIDMNPETVAKCDCLYEVTMELPASPNSYPVRLFRRWDHKSGSDGLTLVGSGSVDVQ